VVQSLDRRGSLELTGCKFASPFRFSRIVKIDVKSPPSGLLLVVDGLMGIALLSIPSANWSRASTTRWQLS
jgi:hypothetical protein